MEKNSEEQDVLVLTLKVPKKLKLYGLYVYYVVLICDFGMLRVNTGMDVMKYIYF